MADTMLSRAPMAPQPATWTWQQSLVSLATMSEQIQRPQTPKDKLAKEDLKQTISTERIDGAGGNHSEDKNASSTTDIPSTDDNTPDAAAKRPPNPTRFSALATAVASFTGTLSKNLSLKRQQKPPVVFPPPSWSLDDLKNEGAGTVVTPSATPSTPPSTEADGAPASSATLAPGGGPTQDSKSPIAPLSTDQPVPEPDPSEVQDAPEPQTLAQRIRAMIAVLPPPTSNPTSRAASPPPPDDAAGPTSQPSKEGSSDAPPIPLLVGADSKLMKWLSSEGVMTGSINKGKESVWSALQRLKQPTTYGGATQTVNADGEGGEASKDDEARLRPRDDDDNASCMVYTDLQPNRDSVLELAEEELEYVEDSDASQSDTPGPEPKGKDDTAPAESDTTKKGKDKAKHTKEVHVWVPSAEKLSVEALWWGYRLYLPPPVMQVLDDSRIAAAKKGAMITAALKWVLDHIPTAIFPPAIRPAMTILKRLTPYLSYVGVFVAWSWGAISARDNGNGVVLTATWLLPVALIPSPWEERVSEMGIADKLPDAEESKAKEAEKTKEDAPSKKKKRGRRDSLTKWEEIKNRLLSSKQ